MRVVLWLILAPSLVNATNYVVAPSGADIAAGTLEFPLKSINAATARAVEGDTVKVRGGTYIESVGIWNSGTAAAPIKLMAYPGETPIIDGQNTIPGAWGALIHVGGSYVEVSGFEVRNSAQYGVHLEGHHNTAQNLDVHHVNLQGIIARGDYSVVEDCQVWQAARRNYNGAVASTAAWDSGLTAARDPVNGITDGAILRRNVVHENWGEGLSTFEANGTVMEDNVVYDNWAVNLYVSDTSNALVQRNLVYATANSVTLFGRPARGLGLSNEVSKNPLNNITIINNIVYGTSAPFVYFGNTGPNSFSNSLIAHNTFVNGTRGHAGSGVTVVLSGGEYKNVRFVNNLVLQDDSSSVLFVAPGQAGLQFESNLWSKSPQAAALSPNDVVGNPLLKNAGARVAGAKGGAPVSSSALLDAETFRPMPGSPALSRGIPLAEVPTDYFKAPRGSKPTVGAINAATP